MLRNKKGMTSFEILAYISIIGLVLASIFVLVSTAYSHYSRADELTSLINEGSRHLDFIKAEIVDRDFESVTSCKDKTNINCVVFSNSNKQVEIAFKELNTKLVMYINDDLITPSGFFLSKQSIEIFENTNGSVVSISFSIHNSNREKKFFTTIRI